MANRPGGLTALAVLNFVFAGIGLIVRIGELGAMGLASEIAGAVQAPISLGMIWVIWALSLAYNATLIVSGVGFIKQSKKLGLKITLVCAGIGIASSILTMIVVGGSLGAEVLLLGLSYPVLLIVLPMTVFKDAFVNP